MTRLWKQKMMPALLAGTLVFSYGGAVLADETQSETTVVTFTDIENHWAQNTIQQMAAKNIINGYTDSTFRPNEAITRLQAVTIVMNLLTQKTNLKTEGDDYIGEIPEWAQENVKLALYNDIVSWEQIQDYNQEATRMFIVELLVNALGTESGTTEGVLTFTDIAQLSTEEKFFLAVALENKFVEGYDDNTFKPNNSVTRAEMAVFANRLYDTVEYDFEQDFERIEVVSGTISRIAADVKELTIGSETFGLANNYTVKINDKDAKFSDLKTTIEVRVILKDGKIAEIYGYTTEKEAEVRKIVTGSIYSVDTKNKDLTVGLKTFDVLDQATVEINGEIASFNSLTSDMETVLVLLDNKVEAIYAFEIAEANDLEFDIDNDSKNSNDDFEEAVITGDRVSDSTPDLEDGRLKISINGASYKTIDLDEIDGSQADGKEVAKELEDAIEDALKDDRVKVTYKSTGRFVFETYDSPKNKVPTIQFDGDSDVLDDLGLDDDKKSGSLGDDVEVWTITVKGDAKKDQIFELTVTVDDEDIDETVKFSVKKGDTAEEIADAIADALLGKSDIRSAFDILVDDEEVTLSPDDNEDWDVEIEIEEQ